MLISQGNFREVACKRLRIGKRTFVRWMSLGIQYPNGLYGVLRRAVLEAESAAEAMAVSAVLAEGHLGDVRHLQWWLERKHPQRWGRYRGELEDVKKEVAELRKIIDEKKEETTE
jgi:hypothetical protein